MTPCVHLNGPFITAWADADTLCDLAAALRTDAADGAASLTIAVGREGQQTDADERGARAALAWRIACALRVIDAGRRRPRVVQP